MATNNFRINPPVPIFEDLPLLEVLNRGVAPLPSETMGLPRVDPLQQRQQIKPALPQVQQPVQPPADPSLLERLGGAIRSPLGTGALTAGLIGLAGGTGTEALAYGLGSAGQARQRQQQLQEQQFQQVQFSNLAQQLGIEIPEGMQLDQQGFENILAIQKFQQDQKKANLDAVEQEIDITKKQLMLQNLPEQTRIELEQKKNNLEIQKQQIQTGALNLQALPGQLAVEEVLRGQQIQTGALELEALPGQLSRKERLEQQQIKKLEAETSAIPLASSMKALELQLKSKELGKVDFKLTQDLRKEFSALSRDFIKVRDAYNRIEASAVDPSAAGDLALIFNYMKVLDPGSVVRESEFATAANSAGVPDRVRAQYNRVLEGERLAPVQRADFVARSRKLYKAQEKTHQGLVNEFNKLSRQAGIQEEAVTGIIPAQAQLIKKNALDSINKRLGGTK